MPALPQMMDCERQAMKLSVPGCVRLWNSAQAKRPNAWEGRHHCLSCPIGAKNAGQPNAQASAARASEALRMVCPRCTRPAGRLVNQAYCVPCYNRVREVARGRNAKGNRPIVVEGRLHQVALAVSAPSDTTTDIQIFPAVTSTVEAMILAAKRSNGPIIFSQAVPAAALVAMTAGNAPSTGAIQ